MRALGNALDIYTTLGTIFANLFQNQTFLFFKNEVWSHQEIWNTLGLEFKEQQGIGNCPLWLRCFARDRGQDWKTEEVTQPR